MTWAEESGSEGQVSDSHHGIKRTNTGNNNRAAWFSGGQLERYIGSKNAINLGNFRNLGHQADGKNSRRQNQHRTGRHNLQLYD